MIEGRKQFWATITSMAMEVGLLQTRMRRFREHHKQGRPSVSAFLVCLWGLPDFIPWTSGGLKTELGFGLGTSEKLKSNDRICGHCIESIGPVALTFKKRN